ncbi:MAG TPA: type VI secretion system lipoprotein TssJ [Steroidobacteraceae bacterium]
MFAILLSPSARLLAVLAGSLSLAACASAPPKPQPLTLTFEAAPELNPSPEGTPSPVVVRVYQLSSDTDFRNASFGALYPGDGVAALGKNLIARQEVITFPGERSNVQVPVASETRAIGILVAYRDIDHATWRLVCAAKPGALRVALSKGAAAAKGCR